MKPDYISERQWRALSPVARQAFLAKTPLGAAARRAKPPTAWIVRYVAHGCVAVWLVLCLISIWLVVQ